MVIYLNYYNFTLNIKFYCVQNMYRCLNRFWFIFHDNIDYTSDYTEQNYV